VGFAALMEAGIDLGFTALMTAAVSGGQHRDRASRPQKELYCDIAGLLFSPTHKRTEGRAPVWGSEFTSKDAALQGGSSRNRC
jgi:hypothetical protein